MRALTVIATSIGLALSVPAAPTAWAQPADTEARTEAAIEQARVAYRLGIELAKQGQWADALAQLERSNRLHPHPTTVYNIGYCERALARYTRARQSFTRALATHAEPNGDRLTDSQLRQSRAFLEEIDARLARVVVTAEDSEVTIAVDGRPLELAAGAIGGITTIAGTRGPGPGEAAPARTFTIVVDPGEHVFALAHPDGRAHVSSVSVDDGETVALTLDVGPAVGESGPSAESGFGDLTLPGWLAIGIGGAGLVTTVVSGAIALDAKGRLDDVCPTPGTCPPSERGAVDRLQNGSKVATVGAAVAVAGLGLGATLLLMSEPDDEAAIVLDVGLGGAALRIDF